jgi:GDSL-like Lipase/Acylhydrolase family
MLGCGMTIARTPRRRDSPIWIANCAMIAASLLVFMLICEFILFRFVLLPSDIPESAFIDGVVRYSPGQKGIYRVANEIAAPFAINRRGWNSGHVDYSVARRHGVTRIAVVGDSFVEALQVPSIESLAEQLEGLLGPERAEVFRFGISGAPLSQYIHMVEREVVSFRPDFVVVVLVHNDFDESFRAKAGRYTSSFLKFSVVNGMVSGEIAPAPYVEGWKDALRKTAMARYFYYRWRVSPGNVTAGIVRLLGIREAARVEANIEVASVRDVLADVRAATHYAFGRLKELAERHNFRPLVLMDGVRGAIYERGVSGALELNHLAAEVAASHGIEFIDLHPVFAADWVVWREHFEFTADGHWNRRGHRVAAEAVQAWLRQSAARSN